MGIDSILWLLAAIAFGIVESVTTALVSVWFVVGAVAALILSFFVDSLPLQFVVFVVVSAAALAVMLPRLAEQRAKNGAPVTNGAPLTIGKQGTVLKAVLPGQIGRVRVDGLDWQAKADTPLAEGSEVVVKDVNGATLIVAAATTATL